LRIIPPSQSQSTLHLVAESPVGLVRVKLFGSNDRWYLTRAMQMAARLDHPCILPVIGYTWDYTTNVITMITPYWRQSLVGYLHDTGALTVDEHQCWVWWLQLVAAIRSAHHQSVAHRNIRPEHLYMTPSRGIQLGHWEQGVVYKYANQPMARIISPFCSPESKQCNNYDPQLADVWSLGVMACWLLSLIPTSSASKHYVATILRYTRTSTHRRASADQLWGMAQAIVDATTPIKPRAELGCVVSSVGTQMEPRWSTEKNTSTRQMESGGGKGTHQRAEPRRSRQSIHKNDQVGHWHGTHRLEEPQDRR
jgi:serine/threonine protein kinase